MLRIRFFGGLAMLTDEQKKAKHDFALHQDNLYWSRMQLLIAVQGAVLAGTHHLRQEIAIAIALTMLGTILSLLILMTMRRDDEMGSKAFDESAVPKTEVGRIWLKGRYFAYLAFALLLIADWVLLAYVYFCPNKV